MTLDWSRWLEVDARERAAMLRRYRAQVRRECESNAARWARMSPAERARYPEPPARQRSAA